MHAGPLKEPRLRAESGFMRREGTADTKPGKARDSSGCKGGATCGCSRRGIPYPYAASSRLDREQCARCDHASPHAPALVKPCSGKKKSAQVFRGSPRYGTTTREKYKGNNKRLQGNVFTGLIVKYNVTLLELLEE